MAAVCEGFSLSAPFAWPCSSGQTAGFRGCGGGRGAGANDTLDVLVGAIKAFELTGTEAAWQADCRGRPQGE